MIRGGLVWAAVEAHTKERLGTKGVLGGAKHLGLSSEASQAQEKVMETEKAVR